MRRHSVLYRPITVFHEGVVVGVADRPDRWGDALEAEVVGELDRGVLRTGVGVVYQLPAGDRVAVAAAVP